MKKLFVASTLIIALLMTCLSGCNFIPNQSEEAAAIFTLDVNPGVRIHVKHDNTVIKVEATNEDGEEVVAELELEGLNYEDVVEHIIDKMEEKGYLEGEESSILISVEKKAMDISEKVNEKINKAFEKHGKKASVIEQELDKLDEELKEEIDEMAEKYHISKGKAHLIEKIREEFPELSEEELAELKVNELGMMLEDTSDDVKGHFKKIGEAVEAAYVGREQALTTALASLELALEDVTMPRVFVTRGEGKMLYKVEFVYDGMEYEITIDAEIGEILATESKEFKEFDAEGFLKDFFDKNNMDPESFKEHIKDHIKDHFFGEGEHSEDKVLSKGEILKNVFKALGISDRELKKTEVEIYETENGTVCSVTVENRNGDVYELVVEAYSGAVLSAQLNGTELELPENTNE